MERPCVELGWGQESLFHEFSLGAYEILTTWTLQCNSIFNEKNPWLYSPCAVCFAPRFARGVRPKRPNAHVWHELHACFSFFGSFPPRFCPDNDVKSPNCRFFRGRKPHVVSFNTLPCLSSPNSYIRLVRSWIIETGFKRVLTALKNITDLLLGQRDPSVRQIWSNDHNCMLFCLHQIHSAQTRSLWFPTTKNLQVAKRHMLFWRRHPKEH